MASQEVQHLFNETLTLLLNPDQLSPQVAVKRIETAIQLDRSQCDLWRALLFTDPSTRNAPKILKAIASSITSFGQLSRTANDHYKLATQPGDPNPISTMLAVQYPASLDAIIELSSPTRVIAAYALQLALEEGRYDDARKQLEQVPQPNSPTVAIAWALIYWHTERWADAKDWAEKLFRAGAYAPDDITPVIVGNGPSTDERAVVLGYLIAGMAHAHFGNDEQATRWFGVVTQSELPSFPAMRRAAYYTLGMMHRARGAFADAQTMFQSAKTYGTTPELDAAVADETIRLRHTSAETINQRASYWEASTEPSLEKINERRRAEAGAEILGQALALMDQQVALTEVKAKVHTFAATQKMNDYWRSQGVDRDSEVRYNFVFQGPPGSGKTVTARAFMEIMYGYGIIKRQHLEEVSAADLVGSAVGQAEELTMAKLRKADGGVIFIDEVYQLTQKGDDAGGSNANVFGKKAAETILKYMEDNPKTCHVIIAGYKYQTDQFIASNPGFKSRFTDYINFVSYTPEELGQIATLMAGARTPSLTFGPGALERFVQRCAILMEDDPNGNGKLGDIAGNGRLVRNFIDKLIEQIDLRLSPLIDAGTQLTPQDATTVTVADVDGALDPLLAQLF